MPTYSLLATECPPVNVPSTWITPDGEAPEIITAILYGEPAIDAVPVWHTWAKVIEALGRYGGGARAVSQGLALSTSSDLNLPVGAGQAWVDIPVGFDDDTTTPASDDVFDAEDYAGVRIFAWLTQGNALQLVNNDPTPPSEDAVFLGSCRTQDGAVVDTDESGIVRKLQGGWMFRRTGDPGPPGDTPPSNVAFLAQTDGGFYLWTGSAYIAILDSQTVKTSGSHSTSGALDAVTVAGTGIALAVVDTGGGVWKLQISFDPETATGIPVVHADSPPSFTVQLQRGGEGLYYVDWSARGSFVSDGVSANHALFNVHPTLAVSAGLDPALLGPLVIEDVGYAYANSNENDYAPEFSRGGAGTILRIRDYSPAPSLAEQNGLVDVTVVLQLAGIGWVDGAEPDDGECVVTELYSAGPHKLEFSKVVTIIPGEMYRYRCDFHARGFFADDYSVRIIPDQGGIACTVLDSLRMVQGDDADPEVLSASFYFDLQTALDTVSGSYGDETEVELRFVLTGPGYREVNPAGTITLTPETYEYPAFATTEYVDSGDAALQAQIDALGAGGGLLCAFAKDDLDTLSGTEVSDYNLWDGPDFGGSVVETQIGGGVIGALAVKLTTAPGSGNSVTATVYINGSSTLATVTVSNTDAYNRAQFIPGISYADEDEIEVRWASSGLSPGINGRCRVYGT